MAVYERIVKKNVYSFFIIVLSNNQGCYAPGELFLVYKK